MTEKPENIPAPDGVQLKIAKIWGVSLIDANTIHSLTDPSEDTDVIRIKQDQIETLAGLQGQDMINIQVDADLRKMGYTTNVSVALAWDPGRYPNAPLVFQSNMPTGPRKVSQSFRTSFLPKRQFMWSKGEHKLVILAQLRKRANTWAWSDGDYTSYSEFPRIGEMTIREVKVIIE